MAVRLLVTALMCAFVLAAHAQTVPVQLSTDNRSLAFALPDSAFGHEGASLSVDIDGYDVTGFSRIDGQQLIVDLDVPLDAGDHALAVFLFLADGSAEIVVDTIVAAHELSGADWSFNTLFETNYRAAEDPASDYEGVDSTASSGSVSIASSNSAGNWGTGASVDAIYDESSDSIPGGSAWQLPSYELYAGYAGERSEAWAVAGNIGIARDDLLFSSYERRGAAVEAAAGDGRFDIKAFSVSSTPRSRFDGDYVLPSDSNQETNGLSTTLVIVDGHLRMAGGFVDGKSRFGGDGYNLQDDPLVYGGDSWNLALDAWWLEDSLWLHLERAESDFDADGIGVGAAARRDDATQATLQLTSNGSLGPGPFEFWSTVLQYNEVGRDFYTLGNLSLPGNIELRSAWFQAGFTSVVLDLEVAEETTNPDENPLFATQTLQRSGASLSWSPVSLDPESGIWKALGAPSLGAWFTRTDNSQPDDDALLAGFDVDNSSDDTGISLSFARDSLSWSIEYGIVDYDDRSMTVIDNGFIIYEPYSDSRNRHVSLAASWMPGERMSFDAYVQRNDYEETDFGDEYRTTNFGLSTNLVLVPDKLGLFVSLSRGKDRNTFGDPQFLPEQFIADYASLQLNWRVVEASGATPAVNFFLKGNYGRNENLGMLLNDEFWAVYIGGSLQWTGSK